MRKVKPPQPNLFKKNGPKIGILGHKKTFFRSDGYTYGLDHIINELEYNTDGYWYDNFDRLDYLLVSLTSPLDIYNLLESVKESPKHCKIIIGGQGCYPFLSYRHLTDKIIFGRAEGIANELIDSTWHSDCCYEYALDKYVLNKYRIRKAQYLLPGEKSVGCNGACKFCQYSATRKLLGTHYNPTSKGVRVVEDRWGDIIPKTGNQTTALDGWSEDTRKKINKPISDEQIIEILNKIISDIDGIMRLKVFQIIGYPWETEQTLQEDICRFRDILGKVKPGKGRVMMMILNTPFSPEPLTAFEDEGSDIESRWRDILLHDKNRCIIDKPHLNAFILPQIGGPLLLYKRICANRCDNPEKLKAISKAKTIEDAHKICGDIHLKHKGYRVSRYLNV